MDRRSALKTLSALALAVTTIFSKASSAVAANISASGENKNMNTQPTQQLWDQCLDEMRSAGRFIDTSIVPADSDDMAAEAVDYLLMTLASAYVLMTRSDPDYPEFLPWVGHVFNYGAPNPDATYYYTTIDGNGSYRIAGNRNTVHWVNFLTGYDFWGFEETPGKSFPSKNLDDFDINPDGSFEILLSNTRPAGYSGNWMALLPETNYFVVRQFTYKPDEVDARMAIERLDKTTTPKLHDRATTEARINKVIAHLKTSSKAWPSFPGWLKPYPANSFHEFPLKGTGEAEGQNYLETLYEIPADQALIIEFKMPQPCFYWNIQIDDRLWRTLEYVNRHTSFNGHTDRADSDGTVRIVVAHQDPGVANWVDTCGIEQGHILLRFQGVDGKPDLPTKRVPFGEINQHLPADTKRVTAPEREQALNEWRMARQMRRSW
jgi:Protein of unknown function (DUF1214)